MSIEVQADGTTLSEVERVLLARLGDQVRFVLFSLAEQLLMSLHVPQFDQRFHLSGGFDAGFRNRLQANAPAVTVMPDRCTAGKQVTPEPFDTIGRRARPPFGLTAAVDFHVVDGAAMLLGPPHHPFQLGPVVFVEHAAVDLRDVQEFVDLRVVPGLSEEFRAFRFVAVVEHVRATDGNTLGSGRLFDEGDPMPPPTWLCRGFVVHAVQHVPVGQTVR